MQGDFKERKDLSLNEFCECIRAGISHKLEVADAEIQKVVKNNDVKLYGLTIREKEGSNISPTIYLNVFYDEYLQGKKLKEIERDILAVYQRDKPMYNFDTESIKNWEWAKSKIVYRLVSMERNREFLKNVPYFPYLDLAVTFHCTVTIPALGDGSFAVHNSHLEMWGITKEELSAVATANTPKLLPPVIKDMEDILDEIIKGKCSQEQSFGKSMYVLTNRSRNNGASCLLYDGVLQEFSDRVERDIFILPSSIHEVILMPVSDGLNPKVLKKMVCEVNQTQLQPGEILSDNVYKYIRATGEITMQEE